MDVPYFVSYPGHFQYYLMRLWILVKASGIFFFFLVVCKIGSVQAACSLSPSTGSDSNISFTFKDCLCGLALPDVKVSLGLGQWFTRCQYSKGFLTLLRVFST